VVGLIRRQPHSAGSGETLSCPEGLHFYTSDVQISVLGSLEVSSGTTAPTIGARKQRALLAALALSPGRAVSVDTLIDLVWGEHPPAAAVVTLHGYVAALRRLLDPGRAPRAGEGVISTDAVGYRLNLSPDAVDAVRLSRTVERVRRDLGAPVDGAPPNLPAPELRHLDAELAEVLELWRGTPYEDLDSTPAVEAERRRLEELRLVALLDRGRLLLALGDPSTAATLLAQPARDNPLREDIAAALARSLASAGRQADALGALRDLRGALADELGIEPGAAVQELELKVLRQEISATATSSPHLPTRPAPGTDSEPAAPGSAAPRPPAASRLVGRDAELAQLEALLGARSARFALLVGEPGIGKTRITEELVALARARGFIAAAGRCSSDEGAPPLWPWVDVLSTLQETAPPGAVPTADGLLDRAEAATAGPGRFRLFEEVRRSLAALASRTPVLLIVDDLHWADASSLRLLQHLVDLPPDAPLTIVGTRRSHPEPHGPLAELGEALARRGAVRIDLRGLAEEGIAALAAGHAASLDADAIRAVWRRTGGNPFFAGEVLRLPDPAGVPVAVGDVIGARLAELPESTRSALEAAAGIGRAVDVDLLAAVLDVPVSSALHDLEPALQAGILVVDPGDGAMRFRHALTRDAVDHRTAPLRRQRLHAELAQLLGRREMGGTLLGEVAAHWRQAGPAHARQAWRAAVAAAQYASGLGGHEEAAELLGHALESQAIDRASGQLDRYEILLARSGACRSAADGDGQRQAADEALRIAMERGDTERAAEAAVAASDGALWSNRPEGDLNGETLAAIQTLTERLPKTDSELRCRLLLALSRELFWSPGHLEAEAWAEQALAMARRLGAPGLVSAGCSALLVATLRPDTLPHRIRLADKALRTGRQAGDPEREAVALLWSAIAAGEAGDSGARAQWVTEALALSARHRLFYLQVMLGSFEVPWLAMQGRFADAEVLLENTVGWARSASFPFRDEALVAARAFCEIWRGRANEVIPDFAAVDERSATDMAGSLLLLLLRAERLDEAAGLLDARPTALADNHFAATMDLAVASEAALMLGRPALAAEAYPLLAPFAGRIASAGTGGAIGPVDAYLSLAAAAVGERQLASRHADDALRFADEWGLRAVADWLRATRLRHSF